MAILSPLSVSLPLPRLSVTPQIRIFILAEQKNVDARGGITPGGIKRLYERCPSVQMTTSALGLIPHLSVECLSTVSGLSGLRGYTQYGNIISEENYRSSEEKLYLRSLSLLTVAKSPRSVMSAGGVLGLTTRKRVCDNGVPQHTLVAPWSKASLSYQIRLPKTGRLGVRFRPRALKEVDREPDALDRAAPMCVQERTNQTGVRILCVRRCRSVPPQDGSTSGCLFLGVGSIQCEGNVDHKMKFRSKKGQLPFVELNGEEIADSAIILKELGQRYDKDLDAGLTNDQKNMAHAMISMIENHLIWY
uniref:(California timema) hypothetical protein n=1 Tax=Timema californicum TaxID=61474 RepID=A0A7R9IYV8_TIMCA|nr:unnamed protein product [Timema californicum]